MSAKTALNTTVLFRVDASLTIGSGHLMRCLTLAQAMRARGWQVIFCCREHPGHQIALIELQGFSCWRLPLLYPPAATSQLHKASAVTGHQAPEGNLQWLGATEQQDAAAVLQLLQQQPQQPDLLVIDHYGLGVEFETALNPHCGHILVIDDLANRRHCADFLLDQNLLPAAEQRYQALLPASCQQFIGPVYALLRPEFVTLNSHPCRQRVAESDVSQKDFSPQPFQLLVFFGGSDLDNLTAFTIAALQELQNLPWLADIVIGSANPHLSLLQQLCEEDHRLTLHVQTPGMATLMAKAQLMIGGGGATHWERCAMALPALVVSLAANQQPTSSYLAQLGACVYLGTSSTLSRSALCREIAELWRQPDKLQQMAQVAATLVAPEGGCQRLLDELADKIEP